MSDRIFGAVGLALSVFYIWGAAQVQLSFITDPVGPRVFPYIIGSTMGLACLAILFKPDVDPVWPKLGNFLEIVFAVAVLVAYTYALAEVGFMIATAVASAILTWRLGTRPHWAVVVGVCTAVGIYFVFHSVLGLSLAKGDLDWLIDRPVEFVVEAVSGGEAAPEPAAEPTPAAPTGD